MKKTKNKTVFVGLLCSSMCMCIQVYLCTPWRVSIWNFVFLYVWMCMRACCIYYLFVCYCQACELWTQLWRTLWLCCCSMCKRAYSLLGMVRFINVVLLLLFAVFAFFFSFISFAPFSMCKAKRKTRHL